MKLRKLRVAIALVAGAAKSRGSEGPTKASQSGYRIERPFAKGDESDDLLKNRAPSPEADRCRIGQGMADEFQHLQGRFGRAQQVGVAQGTAASRFRCQIPYASLPRPRVVAPRSSKEQQTS